MTFNRSVDCWKAGESATVKEVASGKVVLSSGDKERSLPLKSTVVFDVGIPRSIAVCPGDKILMLANQRSLDLINGQILTISKIETDGTIQTREGLAIPPSFKQLAHGYVIAVA